jgi:hypothetical protein
MSFGRNNYVIWTKWGCHLDEITMALGQNDGAISTKRGNTCHEVAETSMYKGFEAWEVLL